MLLNTGLYHFNLDYIVDSQIDLDLLIEAHKYHQRQLLLYGMLTIRRGNLVGNIRDLRVKKLVFKKCLPHSLALIPYSLEELHLDNEFRGRPFLDIDLKIQSLRINGCDLALIESILSQISVTRRLHLELKDLPSVEEFHKVVTKAGEAKEIIIDCSDCDI